MLMQSWPIEEALGVATSTNKKEVEVFPHVAESSVRVLIENSTVWTKGQLPAPSTNSKRLPHEAPILQTLLVSGPGWPLSLREDEGDSNWH